MWGWDTIKWKIIKIIFVRHLELNENFIDPPMNLGLDDLDEEDQKWVRRNWKEINGENKKKRISEIYQNSHLLPRKKYYILTTHKETLETVI